MATVQALIDRFGGEPHCNRWFHWTEVEGCFWPGAGGRSSAVNADLAPVRVKGGVYMIAASLHRPRVLSPSAKQIRYIGETGQFKRRMGQLGASAGFWNERRDGHSAGWRWNHNRDVVWVCFVPLGNEMMTHLAKGFRCWMEALALEEYRAKYGILPQVNDVLRRKESADETGT